MKSAAGRETEPHREKGQRFKKRSRFRTYWEGRDLEKRDKHSEIGEEREYQDTQARERGEKPYEPSAHLQQEAMARDKPRALRRPDPPPSLHRPRLPPQPPPEPRAPPQLPAPAHCLQASGTAPAAELARWEEGRLVLVPHLTLRLDPLRASLTPKLPHSPLVPPVAHDPELWLPLISLLFASLSAQFSPVPAHPSVLTPP